MAGVSLEFSGRPGLQGAGAAFHADGSPGVFEPEVAQALVDHGLPLETEALDLGGKVGVVEVDRGFVADGEDADAALGSLA